MKASGKCKANNYGGYWKLGWHLSFVASACAYGRLSPKAEIGF
jgi:hypothetical protein